jgi:hypothetical protein
VMSSRATPISPRKLDGAGMRGMHSFLRRRDERKPAVHQETRCPYVAVGGLAQVRDLRALRGRSMSWPVGTRCAAAPWRRILSPRAWR